MSPNQRKRLYTISSAALVISAIVGLILYALSQNLNLFYTPTDLQEGTVLDTQTIRLGGMVQTGSVVRGQGLCVHFALTDLHIPCP